MWPLFIPGQFTGERNLLCEQRSLRLTWGIQHWYSLNAILSLRASFLFDLSPSIYPDAIFFYKVLLDTTSVGSHWFLLLKTKFPVDPGSSHPVPLLACHCIQVKFLGWLPSFPLLISMWSCPGNTHQFRGDFSWAQSPKEITKGQPWPYRSSWLFKQLPESCSCLGKSPHEEASQSTWASFWNHPVGRHPWVSFRLREGKDQAMQNLEVV